MIATALPYNNLLERLVCLADDPRALAGGSRPMSRLALLAASGRPFTAASRLLSHAERRRARIYRLVRDSGAFDPDWYLSRYPPARRNGHDPLRHLLEYGAARGFLPSARWVGLGSDECAALAEEYGKAGRDLWRYIRAQRGPGADVLLARASRPLGPFAPQVFLRALDEALGPGGRLELELLIVDHAMGGGANRYRDRRLVQCIGLGKAVGLLTYHIEAGYRLELALDDSYVAVPAIDLSGAEALLGRLGAGSLLVNNLVSYPDVSGTIEVLRRLARDNEIPIDVPLHDYFSICPSFNLLDHRREFCHVPSVSRCRDCIRQIDLPLPARNAGRDIDAWRAAWARLLGEARRIICFSRSSIDLLARAHPGIDSARIELRPHVVDHMPKHTMALDRHAALHIGVVGEISYVKGAAVVAQLADELRRFGSAARLTVIGTVDKDHARAVPETGRYRPERLPELLAEHGVNVCLVPSVWPETYCYVVDELMELGMPVAAFDLGAPAERLRAYPLGIVLPSREPARILSDLETFWRSLRDGGRAAASTAAGTELVS